MFTQQFIRAQIKENIKVPRYWPFVWAPVNSSHKGQWRGTFPFDDVIMIISDQHSTFFKEMHLNWKYKLKMTAIFLPLSGLNLYTGIPSSNWSLSGVPDLWDRNKILSGGDLSYYQVPHCIRVFFYFVWFVFIHHNFQFCAENSSVSGELPIQRPVTRSFDVYFDQRPNKRLSKQSWGWWF